MTHGLTTSQILKMSYHPTNNLCPNRLIYNSNPTHFHFPTKSKIPRWPPGWSSPDGHPSHPRSLKARARFVEAQKAQEPQAAFDLGALRALQGGDLGTEDVDQVDTSIQIQFLLNEVSMFPSFFVCKILELWFWSQWCNHVSQNKIANLTPIIPKILFKNELINQIPTRSTRTVFICVSCFPRHHLLIHCERVIASSGGSKESPCTDKASVARSFLTLVVLRLLAILTLCWWNRWKKMKFGDLCENSKSKRCSAFPFLIWQMHWVLWPLHIFPSAAVSNCKAVMKIFLRGRGLQLEKRKSIACVVLPFNGHEHI